MTEDLAGFFEDGVVAVWTPQGGAPVAPVPPDQPNAHLDMPDQDVLAGKQLSTEYSAMFATASFAGIKHGDTLTINGTTYSVRTVVKLDDGALSTAHLSKV